MYAVQKNIPMPRKEEMRGRPKGALRLTIESLKVGDSFLVESDSKRSAAGPIARACNVTIVTAQTDYGFRVWRKA